MQNHRQTDKQYRSTADRAILVIIYSWLLISFDIYFQPLKNTT